MGAVAEECMLLSVAVRIACCPGVPSKRRQQKPRNSTAAGRRGDRRAAAAAAAPR